MNKGEIKWQICWRAVGEIGPRLLLCSFRILMTKKVSKNIIYKTMVSLFQDYFGPNEKSKDSYAWPRKCSLINMREKFKKIFVVFVC